MKNNISVPRVAVVAVALVVVGVLLIAAWALFGGESFTATTSGATAAAYTQEQFLAELFVADGTAPNENVTARCVGVAVTRHEMAADDPYAWVVGFANVMGYIPEGFDPMEDASMGAIVLVLDRYTAGWKEIEAPQIPAGFESAAPVVQEAASRASSKLGVNNLSFPAGANYVPSDGEVKELLKLLTGK
jgi:hypothetical protein